MAWETGNGSRGRRRAGQAFASVSQMVQSGEGETRIGSIVKPAGPPYDTVDAMSVRGMACDMLADLGNDRIAPGRAHRIRIASRSTLASPRPAPCSSKRPLAIGVARCRKTPWGGRLHVGKTPSRHPGLGLHFRAFGFAGGPFLSERACFPGRRCQAVANPPIGEAVRGTPAGQTRLGVWPAGPHVACCDAGWHWSSSLCRAVPCCWLGLAKNNNQGPPAWEKGNRWKPRGVARHRT